MVKDKAPKKSKADKEARKSSTYCPKTYKDGFGMIRNCSQLKGHGGPHG